MPKQLEAYKSLLGSRLVLDLLCGYTAGPCPGLWVGATLGVVSHMMMMCNVGIVV